MVNGNYVIYGDRPSSESEIVDDHVQTRTAERKSKRKLNRSANDLQRTLNLAQLDNDTDSVKYEKKIKEPRLLRYVSTRDVEENFVTEKFETYDLKATEERPRKYAFQKKTKNPADGSVNYAYSRSSSSCSSPNGNLPTISEHVEQYGTYQVHTIPSPKVGDMFNGYEAKIDKYFKPNEAKKYPAKGSHPDSLYRVAADTSLGVDRVSKVLRLLRWPIALLTACILLAVFIYLLMPDNIERKLENNATFYRSMQKSRGKLKHNKIPADSSQIDTYGTKTPEIDFYDNENEKLDFTTMIDTVTEPAYHNLPVKPVFPLRVTPEVQYGNEKADAKRTAKTIDPSTNLPTDSTLKPHITHKAEKPLAIFFKETSDGHTTESIHAENTNVNEYNAFTPNRIAVKNNPVYKPKPTIGRQASFQHISEIQEFDNGQSSNLHVNFTSGHSKLFGISIEDAERMHSTTQNSLYNTRVSPTLPNWREGDDTTTKKYPVNVNYEVPQCRSTSLSICREVIPYDLASSPILIKGIDPTTLLPQIEFLLATNCSKRLSHFACALMEPECNAPPYPVKKPCYSLCKTIADSCDGLIPQELSEMFNCKNYPTTKCISSKFPCYSREFTCGDGTCIPKHLKCDGVKDCSDGEDENNCGDCSKSEFRCEPGVCIPKRWLCDGYADCADGQDETSDCEYHQPEDLGEEPAGSAPAPAIRLPQSRQGADIDNSKELLVTSDSNNALKKNFTARRPSPSRLKPYTRKSMIAAEPQARENRAELTRTTQMPKLNDSIEDLTAGEFELMDDIKKITKDETEREKLSQPTRVPGPAQQPIGRKKFAPEPEENPIPATRLDKSISKLEKVINGAALLKKALSDAMPTDSGESREKPLDTPPPPKAASSHQSPCPSDELRCVDGRCITLAQLCDGTIDCSDHADEDNCFT